jgi:hypothetical protein
VVKNVFCSTRQRTRSEWLNKTRQAKVKSTFFPLFSMACDYFQALAQHLAWPMQ